MPLHHNLLVFDENFESTLAHYQENSRVFGGVSLQPHPRKVVRDDQVEIVGVHTRQNQGGVYEEKDDSSDDSSNKNSDKIDSDNDLQLQDDPEDDEAGDEIIENLVDTKKSRHTEPKFYDAEEVKGLNLPTTGKFNVPQEIRRSKRLKPKHASPVKKISKMREYANKVC